MSKLYGAKTREIKPAQIFTERLQKILDEPVPRTHSGADLKVYRDSRTMVNAGDGHKTIVGCLCEDIKKNDETSRNVGNVLRTERERFAMELHDGVIQSIFAIR